MPIRKLYIPPTMIVYSVVAMVLLYFHAPQFNLMAFPWNLAGLLVAWGGFALMGKSNELFRKHQTTNRLGQSSALITEGVFSRSRNPMYLGMTILVIGFSILSMNVLALGLPVLFVIHVRLVFIRREEKMLRDSFGEEYAEYCARVRRWI